MQGLFCDLSSNPTLGACAVPRDGGQPCTSNQACKSMQCVPGSCSRNNQTCFTNSQCSRFCSAGPLIGDFCTTDQNCEGHCSTTTAQTCTSSTSCPTGETCVFYPCTQDTCMGDIVCAAQQVTVDYCTGAVGALPTAP
jgi:hypothetical protein